MTYFNAAVVVCLYLFVGFGSNRHAWCYKLIKNDEKCPEVKARSNCDLDAVRKCFYSSPRITMYKNNETNIIAPSINVSKGLLHFIDKYFPMTKLINRITLLLAVCVENLE